MGAQCGAQHGAQVGCSAGHSVWYSVGHSMGHHVGSTEVSEQHEAGVGASALQVTAVGTSAR